MKTLHIPFIVFMAWIPTVCFFLIALDDFVKKYGIWTAFFLGPIFVIGLYCQSEVWIELQREREKNLK